MIQWVNHTRGMSHCSAPQQHPELLQFHLHHHFNCGLFILDTAVPGALRCQSIWTFVTLHCKCLKFFQATCEPFRSNQYFTVMSLSQHNIHSTTHISDVWMSPINFKNLQMLFLFLKYIFTLTSVLIGIIGLESIHFTPRMILEAHSHVKQMTGVKRRPRGNMQTPHWFEDAHRGTALLFFKKKNTALVVNHGVKRRKCG